MDLVRLAIPRRTYTQSHIDYVIEVCEQVAARADDLPAYRIVDEPKALRHFTVALRAHHLRSRTEDDPLCHREVWLTRWCRPLRST